MAAERKLKLFADIFQDLQYGARLFSKSPGFTAVAVLTLALGIGANTAIFSIINVVMLKSLPVRDPQHLYLLHWTARHSIKIHDGSAYGDCRSAWADVNASGCSLSKPFLDDVRKLDVLSEMAEFAGERFTISGNGPAAHVSAKYVSGDFFQALGVNAAVGRVFSPSDDAQGAAAVTVLQYRYWKREFGGDPSVVGRTIHLDGVPFTIVGVAEESFAFLTPGNAFDLSVPLIQSRYLRRGWTPRDEDAGSWWIEAVGRLSPGETLNDAQAKVSGLFLNELIRGDKPLSKAEDAPAITLLSAQENLTGTRARISKLLYTLMLAVGIVLLIACANVAGLLLARATARQKEIAIRLALGAGRARLIRQLITESVLLSAAGGIAGVLLARWSARGLLAFAMNATTQPVPFSVDLDLRVLGFALGAAIGTGVLFGLAPAIRSMRFDLSPALKESAEAAGRAAGRKRFTLGNSLVVAQVGLTVIVLMGAGLLVHTLRNLRSLDPGFATENLVNFYVDATLTGYKDAELLEFYHGLRDKFSGVPGVISATCADEVLLSGSISITGFPKPGAGGKTRADADVLGIGPNFFETMKLPIVLGRTFRPEEFLLAEKSSEQEGDPKRELTILLPAVVNEIFVKEYFPKVNPIGQRFGADGPEFTGDSDTRKTAGWVIVGIVKDAFYSTLRRKVHPTMYVPSPRGGSFELRTAGNPLAVMPAVREIVRQAGTDIPITNVKTQTQQIDDLLYQERLIARLSSFFGVLALLLACIGLYGLLAYEVSRGTREIGIRMALGAQASSVLKRVIAHGILLAAFGAAIGIAASIGVTRYLGSMLYGVHPTDAATLAGVSVILMAVAIAACYVPARRATRVDPLVALRHE
ncbi:MAG TPA: ABC transporter permease [Candidatus Acidoferrales bacterium]|nr:ABC transporter permease [Candidatus Acidoferrales bacterium]